MVVSFVFVEFDKLFYKYSNEVQRTKTHLKSNNVEGLDPLDNRTY